MCRPCGNWCCSADLLAGCECPDCEEERCWDDGEDLTPKWVRDWLAVCGRAGLEMHFGDAWGRYAKGEEIVARL